MRTVIEKFSCDLCTKEITRHDTSGGKMIRVKVGYTDQAGHYNDSEKYLCADCVGTIEAADTEIVPV